MESMNEFIRTQMDTIEVEMKRRYSSLMEQHRTEQMRLSPEDYTDRYGEVETSVHKEHGESPPIPEGCWAIEFQYLTWRTFSGDCSSHQHDYICVDNNGNEYTMRVLQQSPRIPYTNSGWICSTTRKVALTNSLIDLFKTDTWFTAKVVNDPTYPLEHDVYAKDRILFNTNGWGRNVNLSWVKVRDSRGFNIGMTPLNINRHFLSALCTIAEAYNRRFIRYADLYKDGKLREYEDVVTERDRLKIHVETVEEQLQTMCEKESSLQEKITEFETSLEEMRHTIDQLKEETDNLLSRLEEKELEATKNEETYMAQTSTLEKQLKSQERTIVYYRKQNAIQEEEMERMVPCDEFKEVQKEFVKYKKMWEDSQSPPQKPVEDTGLDTVYANIRETSES